MRRLRDSDGKLRMNRKAVSPIISVLLMVAVAVAAAILVYVWSMGLIGTLQTGGGSQTREQIELDAYSWKITTTLSLFLRNVGASDVTVDAVYIAGAKATVTATDLPVLGGAVQVDVTPVGTFTVGVAYTIKVVTKSGGVFTFSCICGRGA